MAFGVKGNTLPWWAIGYCTLLAVIGAMGAFSDAKRSALWYPVGQIVASAGEVLLVMAYFDNATRYAIGELVIPALFGVLTFETYAGVRDVREIEPDPELSDRDNAIAKRIGIVAGSF